ncbi:MAG: protein TolQ [Proteobacteria bacterium]|nr:protein TolQ [Pseudomonadota bacterium]
MAHESLGVFQMIIGASLVVKLVLLLLLGFSATSWAIIILKFRLISKAHKETVAFIDAFWKSRNLADAYSKARQLKESSVARVFRTVYMELKRLTNPSGVQGQESSLDQNGNSSLDTRSGVEHMRRTLRKATDEEVTRMAQLIPFLATAGSTAPFIGLFGTVWGIMSSFQGIANKGSANLAVVAPGIAEALVATAVGLLVAIPSVIAFNYFSQKVRVIDSDLRSFSADFLNIVERDIFRPKGENT